MVREVERRNLSHLPTGAWALLTELPPLGALGRSPHMFLLRYNCVFFFSTFAILNKRLMLSLYVSHHFLPVLWVWNFDFYLASLLDSLVSGHVLFS